MLCHLPPIRGSATLLARQDMPFLLPTIPLVIGVPTLTLMSRGGSSPQKPIRELKHTLMCHTRLLCLEHISCYCSTPDRRRHLTSTHTSGVQGTAVSQPRPGDDEGNRSARCPRTFFFLNSGLRPAKSIMSGCQKTLNR